jgi:hypothetical protein
MGDKDYSLTVENVADAGMEDGVSDMSVHSRERVVCADWIGREGECRKERGGEERNEHRQALV